MLDQLKWYLVQIGLKKYVPMGIMAAFGMFGTYMLAHAGMLEDWGVTYHNWPFDWAVGQEPSGPCILIELGTLSTKTILAIGTLATVAARALQQHTTGAPSVPGGDRVGDPPPKISNSITPPREVL